MMLFAALQVVGIVSADDCIRERERSGEERGNRWGRKVRQGIEEK